MSNFSGINVDFLPSNDISFNEGIEQNICIIAEHLTVHEQKLISYVNKLKLEKKIKFLNFKSNTDKYFSESDLFINTSFFEGFPNSVVESLSNNVPVLCSKSHGGIHDIIKNNTYGNLFDIDKPENLSLLILSYFKNERIFLKKMKKAKKNLKKFSINECVNHYENILNKL